MYFFSFLPADGINKKNRHSLLVVFSEFANEIRTISTKIDPLDACIYQNEHQISLFLSFDLVPCNISVAFVIWVIWILTIANLYAKMTKNKDRSRVRDTERKIGRQTNEKKSGKPILQQQHSKETDDRQRKRHSFIYHIRATITYKWYKKSPHVCVW